MPVRANEGVAQVLLFESDGECAVSQPGGAGTNRLS